MRGRSPRWLCRLRAHITSWIPAVYGPRGMILIALAVVCACFGLAYVGPLARDTPSPTIEPLISVLAMEYWGVLWWVTAFYLAMSAFRIDQSRALGLVIGLFTAWGISAFMASLQNALAGQPNRMWLSGVIFLAMAALTLGVARMLNLGHNHREIVVTPGPEPDDSIVLVRPDNNDAGGGDGE